MSREVWAGKNGALGLLWLAPVLLVVAVLVTPAARADRVVLIEEFTDTGCTYCPYAGQALDRFMNNYNGYTPPGTFALVEYHVGDSYATTWGNSRATFYALAGTPTAWFDGVIKCEGAYTNVDQQYNWYRGTYNQRRAVATDVTISVTGVQLSGQTFTIRARVCIQAGGTAKNLRLYMAQVLDHWPVSPSYSRCTFKQAATTQDVSLSPGQCYLLTRTLTFDSTSWANQSNIKIVVWAQAPASAAPANVYQAAMMSWPFPADCNANGIPDDQETDCNGNDVPDDCDIAGGTSEDCNANGVPDECDIAGGAPDCNENDIPDSCDIASGFSQDANGNGIPDECEFIVGDLNCDLVVDFGDINPFILALSNPGEYGATYPDCNIMNADINGDSAVDFQDINPFIDLLTK